MMRTLVLSLIVFLPYFGFAHHSTNANFTQEIISVEGLIERVRYQNPHTSILIKTDQVNDDGAYWLVESGAKTTLDRAGVSMGKLQVGSRVTAEGRKGRRKNTMYLRKIVFLDGSEFVPQPELN
ncbi:DUF6152 family protein [Gammaproteobacteria bacterium]|nr:DUF6152 family protein [Gammaproteobacteria bacterium]